MFMSVSYFTNFPFGSNLRKIYKDLLTKFQFREAGGEGQGLGGRGWGSFE